MKDNTSPKLLPVPCRYYRVYTDPEVPCEERNFHYVERELPIPVEEAALVLVDVWSTHYIDSWIQRATEIVHAEIVSLLEAARHTGMLVIHAPSPFVVERRYGITHSQRAAPSESSESNWPPVAFRSLYRAGEFADFGRQHEPRLREALIRYETELGIAEPAAPAPGEVIISDGDELHALLAERKILHLFYAGFATNWCVLFRDYGMVAMSQRGYNLILIRDATTGIEFHDSVEALAATQMTVREIETKHGWSTTTIAFAEACRRLSLSAT